jgi:hypothetical protein
VVVEVLLEVNDISVIQVMEKDARTYCTCAMQSGVVKELITIDCNHFNLFEAYISSVESLCTVDSTSSNLRLLPSLDIDILSTLPCFLYIILQVASTPRVLYLSGYHT